MNENYARGLTDGMYEFLVICDQCLTCLEILSILSTSLLLFFHGEMPRKDACLSNGNKPPKLNGRVDQAELRQTALARPRYVNGSSAGRPSIPEFIKAFSHSLFL